ncbi:MAG TPA: chemotaxis response regulator protein-glutamate methylesterase [Candidatus Dormibacteraeota bacterium]|nr:chemotaxis response regulator protein-glutamate methylesterase [Candidatus Dormibacteraeota bacterium]
MRLIRTLIVDDSAFVRKAVREMLSLSPQIDVVGMARNGEDALQMIEQTNPDVVTCDLNMPKLDGVGFVRKQMSRKPLPILLLTASAEDATHVLEALAAGAVDFVRKPTALANNELLFVRQELIEKVKAAACSATQPNLSPPLRLSVPAPRSAANVDIVVLGISTGGPQALRYLLPQFAAEFPVPLVIVLHMPVGYTAAFAEKLSELSRLPVKEASQGSPVLAGQALLAPAGRHLSFKRIHDGEVVVQLSIQPTDKPHRPSVDVMFKSAAEVYGRRVLGVVMTGMGDDGKEGAAWIKAQGGTILTEAEQSCVIYGMPRSVAEAGLSDAAVPLTSIAEEINKRL